MTIELRPWFSFAVTSSDTIVKISWDQPRMTVWPNSTTRERPLRIWASRPSRPVLMTPIRALMTKIPRSVTASMPSRKPNGAESPPIVPGSRVRMRLFHSRSDIRVPPLT